MDESTKTMREIFVELRTTRGWSLKEVEDASGVRASYYHFVEVTNKMPSLKVVKKLSIAYGISPLVFFDAVQLESELEEQ